MVLANLFSINSLNLCSYNPIFEILDIFLPAGLGSKLNVSYIFKKFRFSSGSFFSDDFELSLDDL
jgi:hypothetical protein